MSNFGLKPMTRGEKIQRYGFRRWFFKANLGDSPFKRIMIHVGLILACVIAVYPVLRILTVALRPGNRLFSTTLDVIPPDATFDNFATVIMERDFVLWIWNSLLITVATAIIGLVIASTAAYAFSRWSFPGRKTGLIFLLCTQMIPATMLIIPLYILASQLDLINSWKGIVIAYSVTALPFSIWILKGYYDSIPIELEQAAMVDGATRIGAFYRVILPLSSPALAIGFLFNFTQSWNEFLLARILLQSGDLATWPLGLQKMQAQFQTQWGEFSAAALLVSIPVMILFLASSKWLISGMTLGGVKG